MPRRAWTGRAGRKVRHRTELIPGLLELDPSQNKGLFGDLKTSARRLVICDEGALRSHPGILDLLNRYGVEHEIVTVPGGESAKTMERAEVLMARMDRFGVPRFGEVIGFGGGVVHDVLGVAAGLYRRGVDFRFFGTTLVAAIDAMFSLKCAVNCGWKNRAGLYHPAVMSATDNAFFTTLTDEDVLEGFAEIAKWAIGADPKLVELLEKHGRRLCAERFAGTDGVTLEVIWRTMRGMMHELYGWGNGYETNTKRRSYIGHALSPGLEPDLAHGHAVTTEILVMTMVVYLRGLLNERETRRVVSLYRSVGFDLWPSVLNDPGRLVTALADTTLHRGGRQHLTVPYRRVGQVKFLNDVSKSDIERGIDELHRWANERNWG